MNDESRLPDFLAVGPQRTGTTWLHEVMKPHLGLPRGIKETDFFLKNYSQGIAWYREYFRGYPPELTLGEVDPNYFGEDVARDRIEKDLPRAKIVVTLRDPVERAYSSYRVMRRDAWTRVSFEETVAKNRIIRESSRYAHHLGNWQRSFGKDRVLVCFYDDLEQSPQKFLDQICDFIGAKRIKVEGSRLASERVNTVTHAPRSRKLAQNARNARDWMRLHRWHRAVELLDRAGVWRFCFGGGEEFGALDPEIEVRMRERFRPEIDALERLVGRDLSAWKIAQTGAAARAPMLKSSVTACSTPTSMPRVSVIVPAFNAARTIEQAVESVRAQSYTDFEIVAVDDGSTDSTIEILERYGDSIKILQQQNRGPSAARNLGIANSTGEYLGFLDADDWWNPKFLTTMIAALQREPEFVMAYCDLQLVDSLGKPFQTSLMAVREHRSPTVQDMLETLWPIMPTGAMIRRDTLAAVGGYPEALRAFEDVFLWLLLREQGPFAYVPEQLAMWRFAHFPAPLKASGGQEAAGRIFRQMVKARYGVDPIRQVRSRERAPRSILGYIGLDALAHGDRVTARSAFRRAISLDPCRMRNYLRLARTVLPAGMARALSGKSGRAA